MRGTAANGGGSMCPMTNEARQAGSSVGELRRLIRQLWPFAGLVRRAQGPGPREVRYPLPSWAYLPGRTQLPCSHEAERLLALP